MSTLDKQQFHNETGGYLGVVVLNVKGEEVGVSIPPDGYVFLSAQEQRLTANAPRDPKNNPFVEQEFETIDPASGERKKIRFTPLVPSSDDRFTPGVERPIPADVAAGATASALAAHAATTGDSIVVEEVPGRRAEDPEAAPAERPPARARAAAEAATAPQETTTEPEAPVETVEEETAAESLESGPLPGGVEVGRSQVNQDEFTHGAETGAAVEPEGDAVVGSFSPGEEVGTPDSSSGVATPPPFNPEG
jgi:hypothetical protein